MVLIKDGLWFLEKGERTEHRGEIINHLEGKERKKEHRGWRVRYRKDKSGEDKMKMTQGGNDGKIYINIFI